MPGVKKLHQESGSNSKAEYIQGRHFGFVGLLVEAAGKVFCLPQQGELHEGLKGLREEGGLNGGPATVVTRTARLAVKTAERPGCLCYICVDAYYAAGPMFLIGRAAVNEHGEQLLHIITRAKDNYTAYFPAEGGGKAFTDKDKVHLRELFDYPAAFTQTMLTLYGERRGILYCCVDLMWKPVNGMLRFVCVVDGDKRCVLMCSDTSTSPSTSLRNHSAQVWGLERRTLSGCTDFVGKLK